MAKVILRADVADLGKRGDILDVSDGYARNYLVPKGLAMKATVGAESQAGRMRKARDLRDAQDRAAAQQVASTLVPKVITIQARAGTEGRLFGSVTGADIVAAVEDQAGVRLDRKQLRLDEPIKSLGTHSVPVKLHSDVEFPVTIEVSAD
ncbi:MAG TPA: 50S ribosomal protein L9 [Acidimicrobiales bacterium]|jgi:large subunit ribosomal protein L9|nr:50S ribosomal protein L9 [Acidimicrobiales bacterium]